MAKGSKDAKRKKDKRKKRLEKYQKSQQLKSEVTETDKKLGKVQLYLIGILMAAASIFIFYKLST